MTELLADYGIFLAKVLTIVIAIVFIIGTTANIAMRQKDKKGELEVENFSDQFREAEHQLKTSQLTGKARKQAEKSFRKQQEKRQPGDEKLYLIEFKGSMDAREVESLRREVTALLTVAEPSDRVLVRLESAGGVVHGYGLAAAQLQRIKDHGLHLTVAVDKVAASGGYMMACIADKIVAAPFAIVGSIGVLAQLPNFHRWLDKHDIDFEQLTAGEYKRTLTIFGENTEEGRRKFKADLEDVHTLFKDFVQQHREQLDISKVATGEIWYGTKAVETGLIDEVGTSDDLLLRAAKQQEVLRIRYKPKQKIGEKLAKNAQLTLDRLIMQWLERTRFWHS